MTTHIEDLLRATKNLLRVCRERGICVAEVLDAEKAVKQVDWDRAKKPRARPYDLVGHLLAGELAKRGKLWHGDSSRSR